MLVLLSLFLMKISYRKSAPPPAKSVFGIHDPKGLSYHTQLKAGLNKLNFHKFKNNFKGAINPMSLTSDATEDTHHFLLLCPFLGVQRRDFFVGITRLVQPFIQITDISNDLLTQILLYGDPDLLMP